MKTEDIHKAYHTYLRLERALSENSVAAYEQDLTKLYDYLTSKGIDPVNAQLADLEDFVYNYFGADSNARSQSRILSGVHSFYRFLLYHNYIESDPSELLAMPKKELHLPDVLTVEEINAMVAQIDLSSNEGHRNRAIIEMLYGSGLRVSELVNLQLSNM